MNTLKNLIIIAVLAAVGYGVYNSLSRNTEPSQNASSSQGWPAAPTVELPSAPTSSVPGTLSGASPAPVNGTGLGSNMPPASPLATSMPPLPNAPAASGAPSPSGATAAMPYPSSVPLSNNKTDAANPAPGTNFANLANPPAATNPSATNLGSPIGAGTPPLNLLLPSSPSASNSAAPPNSAALSNNGMPSGNGASSSSAALLGGAVTPNKPATSNSAGATNALTSGDPAASAAASNDMVRNLTPPPDMSPASAAASASSTPPIDGAVLNMFNDFLEDVRKTADAGKLAEAHLTLSSLCNNPDVPPLPAKQTEEVNKLLGELAGSVIYSRQHLLEKPYVVAANDTLNKISQKYDVPWQLLARINGLLPPDGDCNDNEAAERPLPVGMELKVVRGPFDAVVNLTRHELVLMLRDASGRQRYAGRFPIGVGHDQPTLEGTYTVANKTLNPTYYGPDGVNVNPGEPQNPLGSAWIGLTDRIGIHGTSNPQGLGRDDTRGAICVRNSDVQQLYGILSVGSRVQIVR